MVEVMKIMAASFRRPHAGTVRSVPPALQQDIVDPGLRRRLLDTRAQVWLSLLRGLCSFLLGPGAHKVLFVSSKSLLTPSWVSSGGSAVGLMATFSRRASAIPRGLMLCTQSPCPCVRPLLTRTFAGDTQTQFCLRLWVSGSQCAQGLFETSEHLWWV